MTKRTPPFSPEDRERAVRMVLEHQPRHWMVGRVHRAGLAKDIHSYHAELQNCRIIFSGHDALPTCFNWIAVYHER